MLNLTRLLVLALCAAAAPALDAADRTRGAPGAKLTWQDFWTIAQVGREDGKADILRKWGPPDEESSSAGGGTTLRYKDGPSVDLRSDGATQLDFMALASKKFVAAHPGGPLALLGMPCAAAAQRLAFTDRIEGYTSCKHYDRSGWLLDVTMMCTGGEVSTLVVVWLAVPELKTMEALPPDHC
ncbi:MAG TPA: hypothetical protein PK668_12085 [Myxococcota bacterium]|nr:hypothetical protein [Myxococcota bacterium]HRY93793.1 hypothetical protein [Myxococcota bacterium]HSA20465.1 hypothetical protein [Myxococcota bacterium]